MNTLFQLDNIYTDKGNSDTYYDIYTRIYENRRYAKNVMEIGIREGGSLKLWLEYFTFAVVYGIERSLSNTWSVHWKGHDKIRKCKQQTDRWIILW